MTKDKFNYPIFPDRTYTVEMDGQQYKVLGAVLITAYALWRDSNTVLNILSEEI